MLRFLRHFFVVLGFVLVAGCTGGGCSSGCSCAGITPLPLGFDQDQRIQNAAAVRLTDSGLEFLEQNLGTLVSSLMGPDEGGLITFPIENSSGAFNLGIDLVSYEICPGGPDEDADPPRCVAEIDLANAQLQIDPAAPHNIQIHGPLPLRIQNLPIHVTYLFIFNDETTMALNGNDECPPNAQDYANINLSVDISIEIDGDPGHSRVGYSRVRILDVSADEDNLSDSIHFCGGGFTSAIFNGLKGVLIPLLMDSLIGTLGSTIEEQLCQPANPDLDPVCPEGTQDVGGICRYGPDGDAECASVLLGMDGNVDLGAMLASFSPGTRGAFDFVFAAGGHGLRDDGTGFHWGDLDPLGAGITLGMYGGTEPRPLSPCVPIDERPFPEGIPIPDELHQNVLDGWPSDTAGPHFGLAISERFFNYALAQMYNSGALCLGINADAIPQLNTNLLGLGLGAPSMAELGRMKEPSPVALVVRPQRPPHVEFGNGTDVNEDPLLHLTLEQLAIDFYAWSVDRYIRAMTVTVDVDVPANLMVTPEGLQPVLDTVSLANAVVTNNGLLREDPAAVAAGIQELVGTMIGGMLGDAIPPVDLDGALADFGMRLVIPPTEEGQGSAGLRKLEKGDDDFLGIFATLELAVASDSVQADTSAELAGLDLGSVGPTWTALRDDGAPAAEPVAELRLGSSLDDGTRSMQWQVRIDRQPWRPFSSERTVELRGHWLLQQGQHVVQVRSRVAGDAFSLDPTPAEVVLRIDDEPPVVRVRQDIEGWIDVRAGDRVSPDGQLSVRQRLGSGSRDEVTWEPWSDWIGLDALELLDPAEADWIEVEVQDEEGNVGTVQQALIRGRGNVDAAGCQCSLPGPSAPTGATAWLAALLLGAGAVFRRRRGPAALASTKARRRRAAPPLAAGLALMLLSGLWSGCSCSDDGETGSLGCRGRGDCLLIEPGLVGAYSSAAVAPDGVLWVAGYLEANWADDLPFGDLVVGPHDGSEVRWTVVDGVPSEPAVDGELYDPQGFRGGQIEAGEDVGLWTSLAIAPDGMPAVAYYDATHRALRYAHRGAEGWSISVVDERDYADLGRYAKLLFVDGRPVISYLFIQPGEGGEVHSGVRIATGSAAPASEVQWSLADAVLEPATPCRAAFCRPGTRCVLSTGRCEQTTNDCASDCSSSDECVQIEGAPQCEEVDSSSALESYPDAMGLYVSAAPAPAGGIGLAFYDRTRGNVVVARPEGGQWATVIADGEAADGTDSGDMGIGTSLAIDGAGHYHVAYVDGGEEAMRYVTVLDGTTPAAPEVADDGYGIEGQLFGDGKHIVGDDAHIFVTQGGDVRISYQDASAGTLRVAVGTQATDGHDWALSVVGQDGFAGFFSRQIEMDGALRLLNYWRVASPAARGNVRLLSP